MLSANLHTNTEGLSIVELTLTGVGSQVKIFYGRDGEETFHIMVESNMEQSLPGGQIVDVEPGQPIIIGLKCPNVKTVTTQDGPNGTTHTLQAVADATESMMDALPEGGWNRMKNCQSIPSWIRPKAPNVA
ncbi:MAG: hypothetical protein AAFW00_12215 [Bacteroidota bacterium]